MPAIHTTLLGRTAEAPSTAYLAQRDTLEILTLTGVWCCLSLLTVGLRVYVRAFRAKVFGLDDWTIVVTASMGLGIWISFFGECHWALGRHYEAITPSALEAFQKWQFGHSLLSLLGIMLVKISVSLCILRLAVEKHYKIFLRGIIGTVLRPQHGVVFMLTSNQDS